MIDFWATYCGPCISGIKKTADLRERLKGKDISFVFITDKESSPKHKYDEIMENVDGYKHYIEKDEMRLLTTLFNINAIPRYILVDKEGEVVNQQFSISSGMDEVLEKYGIE